ncbi:hypothetical protein [Cellvibrio sp. pealriver]|uniref:hypothetical protein n=1 Tax=Cellvibrio sp. pealriver TaxID=1622269 RepID=UPI00066FE66A|nr:hypothetical protein [Cellvibrio sp. pealriver]
MSDKTRHTSTLRVKGIALTSCFLTVLSQNSAIAAEASLNAINNDLQKIYARIQQKYAARDAQQREIAAAAPTQPPPDRQQFDASGASQASTSSFPPANELAALGDPAATTSRFLPGEELILTTEANGNALGTLFGVTTEKGMRIGLGDFAQILEFPIYVDLDSKTAQGWFFSEKNPFNLKRLDDGRLEVNAGGETYYVAPEDYELGTDFFVEQADVAKWFGLDFKVDEARLALEIRSDRPFAMEVRTSRRTKQELGVNPTASVLPLKESGYKLFSPPMVDIQTSAERSHLVIPSPNPAQNPEDIIQDDTSASYSILASHDLAYLNSQLYLNGNDNNSLSSAWLTFSRQSDKGELLGPLGATAYEFGDVIPFNAGLGRTMGLGRGFKLSNTPLSQLADNRKVNISGPIQEGWDVELYRNGILIDQRLGITEGRYDFNDVLLDYGTNDFQLIFYGPQGQMETKTESYIADSNTVSSGEGMYRFSLTEVGKSVFDLDQYSDDPTQQGVMASSILDYGVTSWLALSGGASVFRPREGEDQEFVTFGANANLGRVGLLSANVLQDAEHLRSSNLSYRTRLLNTSYNFQGQRVEFLNAFNNETESTDTLSASMTGRLFSSTGLPLSYQNSWHNTEYSDGTELEIIQNSLGIGGRFGYLTNNLSWEEGAFDDLTTPPEYAGQKRVMGSVQYRKNLGRLNARFFGGYSLKPVEEFHTYGGAFNYGWSNDFNTELRYTYSTLSDLYQVNLGLNWRKQPFYLTTNAGYNENGSWSAGITLRFSLGYEPIERSLFTSDRPIAQSGAVAVRVFEDTNMNGIFDVNERPIENAKVNAVQAYRYENTDKQGVAVLSSLYDNTKTDIVVDESTLDGPFMISASPGVAIKARKGYVDTVELPVVRAGELDGIIYQNGDSGEPEPAPYIMLNLLDSKQQIVSTTRSEYDGYYQFTNVKPGNYQLKVDENYTDRRNFKPGQKELGFSSKGDVITGVDFVLRPLDEAKGYVAIAGQFHNTSMLKLYYHILRQRLGGRFIQQPFYIRQPDAGNHLLGLAYFPAPQSANSVAEQKAKEACAPLLVHKLNCEVQYMDFKY